MGKDEKVEEVAPKPAEKPVAAAAGAKADPAKDGNEKFFLVGDVVELSGMKFEVKEVTGTDLRLARKDFK